MEEIRSYGEQRFIDDVLAVADGAPVPKALLAAFRPLRVEPHLNGAWLVYKDSERYVEGIYVDRTSLDGWGGSGMDITRWSDKIGWSQEKARKMSRPHKPAASNSGIESPLTIGLHWSRVGEPKRWGLGLVSTNGSREPQAIQGQP